VGVGAGSLQPFRRGKLTRALAGLAHLAFTGAFCGLASPAGTGAGARFVSPDRCCWHPAAMESFDQYDRRCAWWRPRRLSCGTRGACAALLANSHRFATRIACSP